MPRKKPRSVTRRCPESTTARTPCARARRPCGTRCRTTFQSILFSENRQATQAAFGAADHVVAMDFHVGRVTGVPLEPRAALGRYDANTDCYTLYAGSGGAVRQKRELASVLGIAPETAARAILRCRRQFRHPQPRLRRVRPGALGGAQARRARSSSRRPGRRHSSAITRAAIWSPKIELALAADGRFLAHARHQFSNVGARCVSLSPLSKGAGPVSGLVRHSRRYVAGDGRSYQHDADPGLSQLRPPGGHVRDRTADRHRSRAARFRPDRVAAQEPDRAARRCPIATLSA